MMTTRLIPGAALWVCLATLGAAQEPVSPPPAAQRPAEAEPAEPRPEADESRTLEEIFIPSEEIAADEEVTFPINI